MDFIRSFIFFVSCLSGTYTFLLVDGSWDFGAVFDGASDYVYHIQTDFFRGYISKFPNNFVIFMMEVVLFKFVNFLGIQNFMMAGVFVNVLFIDLAVLFLFLYMKKNYSFSLAILSLVFCLFVTPLFLYTPIFYTDTFSVFLPIFLLYCYSFVQKEPIHSKNFIWVILFGFGTVLGMKLKMTVVIMTIAIFIDLLLRRSFKENLKFVGLFLVACSCALVFFSLCYQYFDQQYQFDESLKIPYNQWIKMGMYQHGGYSSEDYEIYDTMFDFQERLDHNNEVILNRLREYGVGGYFKFLNHKVFYTWGDGTYAVNVKLNRNPRDTSNLLAKIFQGGNEYNIGYLYFANSIHVGMLLLFLIQAVLDFKNGVHQRMIPYLSVIGLFVFLLIWETRSRYLYHYIPIFLVIVVPFFEFVYQKRKQN